MIVDVDALKDDLMDVMHDIYNQEMYFIESCRKFPTKYSAEIYSMDLQLRIFFEENNKIVIAGKCVTYCDKKRNHKLKIKPICLDEKPDVIINNYTQEEDTWDQIDW